MRSFVPLFLIFIVVYVLSVVSHEIGHYAVARLVGYRNARIHSTHTDTGNNRVLAEYKYLYNKNIGAIRSKKPYADMDRLWQLQLKVDSMDNNLKAARYRFGKWAPAVFAGGPVVNMLTAIVGVMILWIGNRRQTKGRHERSIMLLAIMMGLIALKPIYETIGSMLYKALLGYDAVTDEYKVSVNLGLYPWTINIIKSVASLFIVVFVVKSIPSGKRMVVLGAAIAGGFVGYNLWHIFAH